MIVDKNIPFHLNIRRLGDIAIEVKAASQNDLKQEL